MSEKNLCRGEEIYTPELEKHGYRRVFSTVTEKLPARIQSEVWQNDVSFARLCILTVPGRFLAETLVIFPGIGVNSPIFGSEYIEMPRKTFGVVDFHPQGGDLQHIRTFLALEPDREVQESVHYDLDGYFSGKLWLKRDSESVYPEFTDVFKRRLGIYTELLGSLAPVPAPPPLGYCHYMAQHDPARGILKAYFGEAFAHDYISGFLFPENPCDSSRVISNLQRLSTR
jgi:hypothetical protein